MCQEVAWTPRRKATGGRTPFKTSKGGAHVEGRVPAAVVAGGEAQGVFPRSAREEVVAEGQFPVAVLIDHHALDLPTDAAADRDGSGGGGGEPVALARAAATRGAGCGRVGGPHALADQARLRLLRGRCRGLLPLAALLPVLPDLHLLAAVLAPAAGHRFSLTG